MAPIGSYQIFVLYVFVSLLWLLFSLMFPFASNNYLVGLAHLVWLCCMWELIHWFVVQFQTLIQALFYFWISEVETQSLIEFQNLTLSCKYIFFVYILWVLLWVNTLLGDFISIYVPVMLLQSRKCWKCIFQQSGDIKI